MTGRNQIKVLRVRKEERRLIRGIVSVTSIPSPVEVLRWLVIPGEHRDPCMHMLGFLGEELEAQKMHKWF